MSTHRSVTRLAGLMVAGAFVFAACSGTSSSAAPSGGATSGDMDALIAAAKAEGGLTTIALPRSWCNYGELIDGFTAKYGIPINGLNPDAGGNGAAIRGNQNVEIKVTLFPRRH